MSREQLEQVAQEHQVKNIKKLTSENLAYAILDAQATAASQQPIEKPKGKRGRPRKNPLPDQAQPSAKEKEKDNKKTNEQAAAKDNKETMV